ncbi:integral membrane sensor signal transduction histidine kinase [Novosphingobium sp. Rr 2-17]|uniref:HAMP domain-containing sensor histidine kinase n=1 Tax=Novosphingobium sp. Rr 2-17 TaxID=555793 RepID=UPI000269A562|nr:HAMP domain-containing sensor histidine kinase [Novosphingobium sp. Rr 2-17]EIZ77896.1 integral membrane sensor signal transduction histidine kinase [Novosphingobium sp. Rr 2-17]
MKRLPQSLRGLTIAFLALFLATTALAGFGIYYANLSIIYTLVDRRIESESDVIAAIGEAGPRADMIERINAMATRRDTADLGLLLTDAQGRVLAGNARFSRPLPLGFSSLGDEDRIKGLSAGRVLVRDLGEGMRLAIFAETEPVDNYFAVRQRIYLIGFCAIVLVVLTGLLLFRRVIGQRIDAMRRTAESIIEGDLTRRVPVIGDGGEFDQQAAAFNRMLDRIAQLMGEIRNVTNDISHEMRTPLARLRNELSLLEQGDEAGLLRPNIEAARAQADELLTMFGAMLRIAEIDNGSRRAGFQRLDIGELVGETVELASPLAQERGQRIVVLPCQEAPLSGDRQLLSQLLLNLLENALKHTDQGTTVTIAVQGVGGHVVLSIADDGPGIPADQRALVMRRFGRMDRSHDRAGHGLGLPLAAAIVRLHHGTMVLEDASPGLRIVVKLAA